MSNVEHFVRLARTGKSNRGASGGEKRAYALAKCILENAAGLDEEAIEGAGEFLRMASQYPNRTEELIEAPSPLGRRQPA